MPMNSLMRPRTLQHATQSSGLKPPLELAQQAARNDPSQMLGQVQCHPDTGQDCHSCPGFDVLMETKGWDVL